MAGNTPITQKKGLTTVNFAECIDDTSLSDGNFGVDGGAASMTYLIPFLGNMKVLDGFREVLGYHVSQGQSLRRKNPMRHPFYGWLSASRISSVTGVGYRGKMETGWGVFTNWDFLRVTVQFTAKMYDELSDDQVAAGGAGGGEFGRYVEKRVRCFNDYLCSDRSDFIWADPKIEATGLKINGQPQNGKAIKSGIAMPVAKAQIQWKWRLVPPSYVMDSDGIPRKLLACAGKVNNAQFPPGGAGYPAGTLLCEDPLIEPSPAAIPSDTLFGNQALHNAYVDVTLNFLWIDPPTDGATRGHNLFPNPNSPQGYWHRIATKGGAPRFMGADFQQLFRHHSA